jgi:hypothetical protein
VPKYRAFTKYDEKHEAISTSLYDLDLISGAASIVNQDHHLLTVAGWKNTDDMVKEYHNYLKRKG